MISRLPNKYTPFEFAWNTVFQRYRTDILSKQTQWWKEEDIYDKSCGNSTVGAYFIAQLYVSLIYLELQKGYVNNWSYIETKYDFENMFNNFICKDINIRFMLEDMGLILSDYGINTMNVEGTNIVEPSLDVIANTNLINILTNHNSIIASPCSSIFQNC